MEKSLAEALDDGFLGIGHYGRENAPHAPLKKSKLMRIRLSKIHKTLQKNSPVMELTESGQHSSICLHTLFTFYGEMLVRTLFLFSFLCKSRPM